MSLVLVCTLYMNRKTLRFWESDGFKVHELKCEWSYSKALWVMCVRLKHGCNVGGALFLADSTENDVDSANNTSVDDARAAWLYALLDGFSLRLWTYHPAYYSSATTRVVSQASLIISGPLTY